MLEKMIDPITALAFSIYENKGVYCLLLGSGVSRPAEIPTGWEVTLDLVRRIGALQGVQDEADWAAWYRATFGAEPKYSELLDQLASTPDERRSVLHSYIEPNADDIVLGKKVPTRAHHAIARLVAAGHVRVIITTNFDRLIENALRENGVEPTVISSDDTLKGAVPLIHSRCYVLKIHGDYLDTRIKNTDSELGAYTPDLDTLLDRIIDEHGLIVCGWSSDWDPALRAAITRAPSRRYPMFWAARGQMSSMAETLISHRTGKVIAIEGADAFFEKLESLVSTQAEAQRPNPRSAELLVSSAKKFLARPEYRIQLDQLIGDELRRIDDGVIANSSNLNGAWSSDRFNSIVAGYESQAEVLVRIFGILGRYGTGDEFRNVQDVIVRFGFRESGNGLVILLGLRTYPAVLLFYAYGIGLVKAQRFADLFKLFSTTLSAGRDTPRKLVSHLYLEDWDGGQNDAWKLLPGQTDHKTALSDHLHELFQSWTIDYIFTKAEFTSLFEHFELLATLASISLANEKVDLQAAAAQRSSFVWCPIGRAAWDGNVRRPIIESWKGDLQQVLLKAGFARGDEDYLLPAIQSIDRMCQRFRW